MKKPLISNFSIERIGVIISLCLISLAIIVIYNSYKIDLIGFEAMEISKLIATPKQYGADELIKKKIVDVDVRNTLDGQSDIINEFLVKTKEKKSAVLKTLIEDEGGLAVVLYVYDNKASLKVVGKGGSSVAWYHEFDKEISPISITKYYPQLQCSVSKSGQSFSGTHEVENGDAVNVYLKVAKVPDFPDQLEEEDQFLYSYYKN